MAVVVPILASAAAGAMGMGMAMTGVMSVAAGLVSAKSGLSKRIDRAASKVFGEDLVKVGNVVGAFLAPNAAQWGAEMAGQTAGWGATMAAEAAAKAATAGVAQSTTTPALIESAVSAGTEASGTLAADGLANTAIGGSSASAAKSALDATASKAAAVSAAPALGDGALAAVRQQLGPIGEVVGKGWDAVSSGFNKLSPQAQQAVIQTGGNMAAGFMNNLSQAELLEEQARMKRRDDEERRRRFLSGSGLSVQSNARPLGALGLG